MTATATAQTLYRRFTTEERANFFEIIELEPSPRHPINWSCLDGRTEKGAWADAQCQHKPVIVRYLDGSTKELGDVFDPRVYEQAVYGGYVGYGLSMSDGHYAPIDFESWIKGFRKDVLKHADELLALKTEQEVRMHRVFYGNDASKAVKNALFRYVAALVKATSGK